MSAYTKRKQRIWMLGIRSKRGGVWERTWGVTSMRWFDSRKEVKEYIATEIDKRNFETYEYKPIRYGPVKP